MDAGRDDLGLRQGRPALSAGLSARHVGELAAELSALFAGRRVRAIAALPPRDLLLVFEPRQPTGAIGAGGTGAGRLRLSCDPDGARAHAELDPVPHHEGPPGPFYRRAALELEGALLARLSQVRGDRILLLEFRETRALKSRALVLELTGRSANLALLDEGERVLAALVEPSGAPRDRAPDESARGGAARGGRLAVGAAWEPPRPKPGAAPRAEGPPLTEAFPPDEPLAPGARAPLSMLVARAFATRLAARDRERAAAELARRVERKLARAASEIAGIERRKAAAAEAERVRQDGELLKGALDQLHRGQREVELDDWFAPGTRRKIELDPKLAPRENLERIFQRYHKLERTAASIGEEEQRLRDRHAALEALRAALDTGDPEALARAAEERGLLEPVQPPPERREVAERLPYKVYRGGQGSEIRVGRSADDNDELTFRHARGNDVWLHTADSPGSHVVLRLEGRDEPDPDELIDAAHLAVHFSPLRGAARASVHVARRKEVHKPRKAKAGLVSVSGGKILHVRIEPQRLARLLARAGGPAGDSE